MKVIALWTDGSAILDTDVLTRTDQCFGRYDRTSAACKGCTAPVVAHGHVILFRDLCANGKANPCNQVRASDIELLERLQRDGPYVTWLYLLGEQPVRARGADARRRLSTCLTTARRRYRAYLEQHHPTIPSGIITQRYPNLPTMRELLEWHSAQQSG